MQQAAVNERLKLLATALNNLALAFIVSGVIVPLISGMLTSGRQVGVAVLWVGLGAALHGCGQFVLGFVR